MGDLTQEEALLLARYGVAVQALLRPGTGEPYWRRVFVDRRGEPRFAGGAEPHIRVYHVQCWRLA